DRYSDLTWREFEIVIGRRGVATHRNGTQIQNGSELEFVIDPTRKPAHLEMIKKANGFEPLASKCIYRVDGDVLQIVYNSNHAERPKSFDLKENPPNSFLMEYKRVKEEKK